MAEDAGEKTEPPTARRRQEAREQGNIARSADLTASVLLIGGLLLMKWFGIGILAALRTILLETLSPQSLGDVQAVHLRSQFLHILALIGVGLAPVLGGVFIIVVIVNLLQVGFFINVTRLQPNLGALNPFRGINRLFGGGQGLIQLLMNLLKVSLVGYVAWTAVGGRLAQIVAVQQFGFLTIFALAGDLVYSIAMRVGIVLLILAILDYIRQRFRIEKQLRMTKMEVKEEMRRMEGDPKVKGRRRQIALQRALHRLKKEVPTADVVVTNPTHVAVALKYDEGTMHAPKLVAKGADLIAMRIRLLASEAGIPIVERPPLARAIYRTVEVGQEIPEEFYAAVAEILAYVYELTGKARRNAVAV